MTDKLYLITEADRDNILHALSVPEHADEGENATAIVLLQSLPMVSGEPVAYRYSFSCGEVWTLSNLEPGKAIRVEALVESLYTSPQPLQPITAADITPAMHREWNKIFRADDMSVATPSDGAIMAAAYNAVIKGRAK